ncbi:hypothetical protein B0H13DRAFT_2683408 [Mycena leptocephala]|nr:hypothetical protein B0H13DRAFT_2683408 [Mycena leptocephala]
MSEIKDRLHAIWICISVPMAGDRVTEAGVEEIIKMERGRVPLIVVFTKYDQLVGVAIFNAPAELDDEQVQSYGETKASEAFRELCVDPLQETVGNVLLSKVSTKPPYRQLIEQLIKATDEEVRRHQREPSHTEPVSLAWAIAQRGNSDTNIQASIDVGRRKYWSGLLSSTDFTGQKIRKCLNTIHIDVVSVWNMRDPSNYLTGEDFKARMSRLVDELVTNLSIRASDDNSFSLTTVTALATAASSTLGIVVASVGSAVLFASWGFDVYQNAPKNIACVMGYVVDLTIVMHRLFAVEVSEERVVSVLEDYAKSGEITQVHNDIRTFVNSNSMTRQSKDNVLLEIIRLIEKHRADYK